MRLPAVTHSLFEGHNSIAQLYAFPSQKGDLNASSAVKKFGSTASDDWIPVDETIVEPVYGYAVPFEFLKTAFRKLSTMMSNGSMFVISRATPFLRSKATMKRESAIILLSASLY